MDSAQFIYLFDILCLTTILGGALSGFIRGTKKSIFYLIFFTGFLLVGFLAMPFVGNLVLKSNIAGYDVHSLIIEQVIKLNAKFAPLFNGDTISMQFMDSVLMMAFRIAWIILIITLASTIWQFITWIFWTAFAKRGKKSIGSRLIGACIGVVNSLIVILFMAIPLAGISSMAENLSFLTTEVEEEQLQLSFSVDPKDSIGILTSYSDTVLGKAFKEIKLGNTSYDLVLFDEIVYLKYNNKKIKLRQEIVILGELLSELNEQVGLKSPDLAKRLLALDEETKKIYIDKLSELDLINAAIPLGIEYIYYIEPQRLSGINLTTEDFNQLLTLNFKTEFKNLGYAVVEVYELTGLDFKQVNLFHLDPEIVTSILTNLSELDILEIAGPIGFNYLLNNPKVASFIGNDFNLDNFNYKAELINIASLYEKIVLLGIDSTNFKDLDYSSIDDEKIAELSTSLYQLQIVKKATPAVMTYLVDNVLPKEITNYVSKDTILEVTWNDNEISSILLLGKVLLANGALDEKINIDNFLTESTSAALAKYMIQSELISSSITPVIKGFLETQNNATIKAIHINDDFTWSEEELYGLFTIARLTKDLVKREGIIFDNITNENIDDLSDAIVSSNLVMNNLTNLINVFASTPDAPLSFEIKEDFTWNYKEINSILKSLKIISTHGGQFSNVFGLSDEEINTFLDSTLITETVIDYLYRYTAPGGELEGILVINITQDDDSWYDREEDSGELRKIIKSLGILLGNNYNMGDSINLSNITSLNDEKITILLDSIIVFDSIKQKIIDLSLEGNELHDLLIVRLDNNDAKWNDTTEAGELRKFLQAFNKLFGQDFDLVNPNLDITHIINQTDEDLTTVLSSSIISDSIINAIYNLSGKELLNTLYIPNTITKYDNSWYGSNGELFNFIKAVKQIIPTDGNIHNVSFEVSDLYDEDKTNLLLDSIIFKESIIKNIESSSAAGTSLIVDHLRDDNELENFISGVKIIIPDGNVDNISFNLTVFYDDNNLDTLLNSKVIHDSIIHYITSSEVSSNKIVVITNLNKEGELRKFFKSVEILIPDGNVDNINFNLTVFYNDINLDILLDSQVIHDSIIHHIESTAATNNNALVTTSLNEDGELRKFFKSVEILIPDGELNNIDFNLKVFYNDSNLDVLLDSRVIHDSIIYHITSSDASNNNTLVTTSLSEAGELRKFFKSVEILIPDGEVNNINFNLKVFYSDSNLNVLLDSRVIHDSIIYHITSSDASNNNTLVTTSLSEEGELRKFFKSVEILIPDGDIDQINFSIEKIYHRTDIELDHLLASSVIKDSIYTNIESSPIAINGSLDITNLRAEDELKHLIRALEIIIPNPTSGINDLDFEISNFYKSDEELNKVLASRVVSDSVILRIESSPVALDNTLDTTYLRDEGELKVLIYALQIIIPAESIDSLTIDINNIMYVDLDILLASRVMEQSIINQVKILFTSDGALYDYLELPTDVNWERDRTTDPMIEGDLKPFLEALRLMDQAGVSYSNINITTITSSDSNNLATALLHSRIISNSISKMLNKVLSDAGVAYIVPQKDYTHPELVSHLDAIKFMWVIYG